LKLAPPHQLTPQIKYFRIADSVLDQAAEDQERNRQMGRHRGGARGARGGSAPNRGGELSCFFFHFPSCPSMYADNQAAAVTDMEGTAHPAARTATNRADADAVGTAAGVEVVRGAAARRRLRLHLPPNSWAGVGSAAVMHGVK
jgi:hypothetical protein